MIMTKNTTSRYVLTFPADTLIRVKEILEDMLASGKENQLTIPSLVCFFIFDAKVVKSQESFLSELIKLKTNTNTPTTYDVWYIVKSLLEDKWRNDYDIVRIAQKHNFLLNG